MKKVEDSVKKSFVDAVSFQEVVAPTEPMIFNGWYISEIKKVDDTPAYEIQCVLEESKGLSAAEVMEAVNITEPFDLYVVDEIDKLKFGV